MNSKLKDGLRKAAIGDGRRMSEALRKQRAMLKRGVVDPISLEEVLRNAEAAMTILAGELGEAMDQETIIITQIPAQHIVSHAELGSLRVGQAHA